MQLAFAAAGAAIGSGFGGIAALGLSGTGIGWSLGGMLGGMFGPTQKVQGPRLANLKLTDSAYGTPIPYVFGHQRLSGQVIWGSSKREIATTTSTRAKGGPKVKSTTFTYEVDLLVKLTCNPMAGILKMFVNGELQWTASSDADYGSINASGILARRITVYRGDDDQLPDPTYEAAVGIGNAPAYRGALTVMFESLDLGNSGQIPNITFEVVGEESLVVNTAELMSRVTAGGNVNAYSDINGTTVAIARAPYFTSALHDVYWIGPDGTQQLIKTVEMPGYVFSTLGRSDRPVAVTVSDNIAPRTLINFVTTVDPAVELEYGGSFPSVPPATKYSISGDDIVVSNANSIFYFNLVDSLSVTPVLAVGNRAITPLATASTPATNWYSHAIHDGQLYSLPDGAGIKTIQIFDLETMAPTGTITTPNISGGSELIFDEEGFLYVMSTTLFRWDGAAWTALFTPPSGYAGGAVATGQNANSYLVDGVLTTTRLLVGSDTRVFNRVAWQALSPNLVALDSVVQELCERASIEAAFIDVSSLAGKTIAGYAITPTSTRQAIEVLAQAKQFEAVCSDRLRFVSLGGAPKRVIPWNSLGTTNGGTNIDALPLTERNDIELPAFVTIKYSNVLNDFQDGAERSSRIATYSDAEQFIELAMAMTPSEAKISADFIANLVQSSRTTVDQIKLSTAYCELEPTDVLIVQDSNGSTYRVRVGSSTWADGIITLEGLQFDSALSVISDGLTSEDYTSTSVIRSPSATIWEFGDWPLFRDVDDNFGYYVAAKGAGDFWPGASIQKSPDDLIFQEVAQITDQTLIGTASTALATYTGPNMVDNGNSITVDFGAGVPSSITYAEQIAELTNVFMIGSECVIVRDWTYVSAGVYRGSGLLRGRKGTEWAVGTHAVGEAVVKIQLQGIRRVTDTIADWNVDYFFRAVTFGRSIDSTYSKVEANTGVSSIPLAPTNLDATRVAGTSVTVFWNRRTRVSENWLLGTVPLGEEAERWQITRYTNNTYTTVAETQESTTASYTFAIATDPIYVEVRQWSARVGWGYALRGAI